MQVLGVISDNGAQLFTIWTEHRLSAYINSITQAQYEQNNISLSYPPLSPFSVAEYNASCRKSFHLKTISYPGILLGVHL